MRGKPTYYWDSCIFIAWVTNEKREPGQIEGMETVASQVMQNKANLCTSVLTRNEVLEGKMKDDERERFKRLFFRKNVVPVDMSDRVLDLAREVREWNHKISTQDSIHLATAILYNVTEFHTTDGSGRKRAGDLIPLSGNVNGHKLKICVPMADQLNLYAGMGKK